MQGPTIEASQRENVELREQIDHLRKLIITLSATSLQRVAVDLPHEPFCLDVNDGELLVREAEECFRCARLPDLKKENAEGLEAAGLEFLAKAVEVETKLQREKRNNKGRDSA